MRESLFESLIGLVVVAVAGFFLWYSIQSADRGGQGGTYELSANFYGPIDGVSPGTDVRLMGVKVGVVTAVKLDKESLLPQVRLAVENDVKLDDETTAKIAADGFLGGNYINLVPGGGLDTLEPGGAISNTSSPLDLGALVSEFAQSLDRRLKEIADNLANRPN